MSTEYRRELLKWIYTSEVEQNNRLDTADGLLFGVTTVLAGVGTYYVKLFAVPAESTWVWVFRILAMLFAAAIVFAIIHLTIGLRPRIRAMTASASEIKSYLDGLQNYHEFHGNAASVTSRVDADLQDLMDEQFIKAGQLNRDLVKARYKRHVWAKYGICAAVLILILNAFPTYVAQSAYMETQKVDLVELPNDEDIHVFTTGLGGHADVRKETPSDKKGAGKGQGSEEASQAGNNRDQVLPQENQLESISRGTKMSSDQEPVQPPKTETPEVTPETPSAPEKPTKPDITRIQGGVEIRGNTANFEGEKRK